MALSSLDVGPRSTSSPNDELKTQFMTREGTYKLMTLSEYSRPNRVGYANNGQGGPGVSAPVKVSFASVPPTSSAITAQEAENGQNLGKVERITFNFGREIFVYPYKGVRKAADLTKPIDKRVYKGTCPTCHDFSEQGDITPLLVGFSGGQIQLVDPVKKELSKLFNEERHIDKSRVTCIKWLPESSTSFLVSYASGCLYLYDHEVLCCPGPPTYQLHKQGRGYAVYTCKIKGSRNPLYRWTIGKGSLNEFAFSPCGQFLATVSQDGYLRIFNYETFELTGLARSYFGGLLCVCWSPDSKFLVFGGEDDLVNVYSLEEKRVVVRGQGHKSWVSVVAFDPFNVSYGELPDGLDFSGSDDEGPSNGVLAQPEEMKQKIASNSLTFPSNITCYRIGSVGQDTLICLWDLTEDILKQSSATYLKACSAPPTSQTPKSRVANHAANHTNLSNSHSLTSKDSGMVDGGSTSSVSASSNAHTSLTQRLSSLNFGERQHRRNFSLPTRGTSAGAGGTLNRSNSGNGPTEFSSSMSSLASEDNIELGGPQCPRLSEIPTIEPLIVKKIAQERLTALVFREECLVTACQDGYVCTWARPGKISSAPLISGCPGSPRPSLSYQTSGNGTIV